VDHSQAIIARAVTGAPGNGNANGNANVGGNDDPSSGTRLGDFTLLKRLGRGAQGEVYEAREESLGRLVALKVLPPYLTFNPERVQRFKREAEAGGRLDHPNTVGVHSVGEASGYHYIAQELVAGGRTVADRIAEVRREAELPRDWYEKTAALFVDVAEAVHAAHEAGIVHRDIKPGNILLTHDGQPKVADFGLAMVLDDLHRSRSGELIGTPFYMSPEQAAGGRAGLDRRTDVFSLGTTLYESLTLLRPFDGETREQVVERILLHDPPDPRKVRPSVPRELAIICMKALEKKRERRYQTAAGFADDVRRWLRHEPIVARPPGAVVRAGKWLQRHPVSTGFAAAFVLVVALLIKANSAEDLADAERRKAEANDQKRQTFLSSLLSDVFEPSKFDLDQPRPMPSATDPYLAKVGDLEKLAARLGPAAGLPEERCHLLTVAGMAYANYSLFDDSNRCLVAALDQARALDPSDPENAEIVAHAALELGRLRRWTHDWPEARSLLSEARALFAERRGEASEQVCAATLPSRTSCTSRDGRRTRRACCARRSRAGRMARPERRNRCCCSASWATWSWTPDASTRRASCCSPPSRTRARSSPRPRTPSSRPCSRCSTTGSVARPPVSRAARRPTWMRAPRSCSRSRSSGCEPRVRSRASRLPRRSPTTAASSARASASRRRARCSRGRATRRCAASARTTSCPCRH
jgi:serine/threonine protein kinase